MKKLVPQGHEEKEWGIEVIWSNNEFYCGKILMFSSVGKKSALVLHRDKKKSWFVNSGKFKITFVDLQTGENKEAILEEGQTVDIADMSPHQLEALIPNSTIFEVGTPLYEEDLFKLNPGDDRKRSLELK